MRKVRLQGLEMKANSTFMCWVLIDYEWENYRIMHVLWGLLTNENNS